MTPPESPSAYLEIRNVSKTYGDFRALDDCSLTIRKGELIALLGPSGCGKSTLLSLIAGLQSPDSGDILLGGRSLIDTPINRRQVGMVFQSYALFPHMTVWDNIGYGLTVRREAPSVARERTQEMLALLKLDSLSKRYPAELSGGQQQRVAVARALATRPVLMLLDEALSALDKNLREEMQIELALLLRRAGITTILVTHDQREAFAFGDRIAIMNKGIIVQVGRPEEVYRAPQTAFTLDFLGSVTCFAAEITPGNNGTTVARSRSGLEYPLSAGSGRTSGPVKIYVRSEGLYLSRTPTDVHRSAPATVTLSTFLGSLKRHVVDTGFEQVLADAPASHGDDEFAAGDKVFIGFRAGHVHVLPGDKA
ncbi:MAG: ABC transporter ATP-binding protein [Parvibaculaceae bacterium]